MKKIIVAAMSILAVIVVGSTSMTWLNTAVAAELKIGVINLQLLMQNSDDLKSDTEKLREDFSARETKITEAQKKFQETVADLKRDSAVMKKAKREAAEKNAQEEQLNLQKMVNEYKEHVAKERNEVIQKFLKKVEGVVNSIAAKDKYDIILQSQSVAYADGKLNITEQVAKKLGQKIPEAPKS